MFEIPKHTKQRTLSEYVVFIAHEIITSYQACAIIRHEPSALVIALCATRVHQSMKENALMSIAQAHASFRYCSTSRVFLLQ